MDLGNIMPVTIQIIIIKKFVQFDNNFTLVKFINFFAIIRPVSS